MCGDARARRDVLARVETAVARVDERVRRLEHKVAVMDLKMITWRRLRGVLAFAAGVIVPVTAVILSIGDRLWGSS